MIMAIEPLYAFDLSRWETQVGLAAGLASALLIVFVRYLIGWAFRGRPAASPRASRTDLAERRRTPRGVSSMIRVLLSDPDFREEPCEGWVIDRTMDGLAVLVSRPVEVGLILGIRPPRPSDSPWAVVEVRRCEPQDGRWLLGRRFVNIPPW